MTVTHLLDVAEYIESNNLEEAQWEPHIFKTSEL